MIYMGIYQPTVQTLKLDLSHEFFSILLLVTIESGELINWCRIRSTRDYHIGGVLQTKI